MDESKTPDIPFAVHELTAYHAHQTIVRLVVVCVVMAAAMVANGVALLRRK